MNKRGFIGLLMVLIVSFVILASVGYSAYHNRPGGFTGQIFGQLERPGNILHFIISTFSTSTATSHSTTTVAKNVSTSSNLDIPGWKTYVNSQYGFSFEYPSNLTPHVQYRNDPQEKSTEIDFASEPNSSYLILDIGKHFNQTTGKMMTVAEMTNFGGWYEVKLGNRSAVRIDTLQNGTTIFLTLDNGEVLTLEGGRPIIDKVVSTFKFTK